MSECNQPYRQLSVDAEASLMVVVAAQTVGRAKHDQENDQAYSGSQQESQFNAVRAVQSFGSDPPSVCNVFVQTSSSDQSATYQTTHTDRRRSLASLQQGYLESSMFDCVSNEYPTKWYAGPPRNTRRCPKRWRPSRWCMSHQKPSGRWCRRGSGR